jgi:hypothetical protein
MSIVLAAASAKILETFPDKLSEPDHRPGDVARVLDRDRFWLSLEIDDGCLVVAVHHWDGVGRPLGWPPEGVHRFELANPEFEEALLAFIAELLLG